MGEPGVPQPADQQQPLVDHAVVDIGVAYLDRIFEELGDQHVLALGGDLHDPVRLRRADPDIAQEPQHVVLVLGQPTDRLEGLLVFQGAVLDGAPDLVPAVGADVALGVQLREQVLIGATLDPKPERRGTGR